MIKVIGDIHGRDIWKHIEVNENDKIIFVGDYLDSFYIPSYKQLENLKNIIELKKLFPDKIILLLGNHDYHYLPGVREHYPGYQSALAFDYSQILYDNLSLFQIIHIEDKFLFSHAGVSNTWLSQKGIKLEEINDYLKYNYKIFGFSGIDSYGNNKEQGPLWIRPNSLKLDYLKGYTHVVGHTAQKEIKIEKDIILIDVLDNVPQYLTIQNNIPYVKSF